MKIMMNTGGLAATNCFLIADENARQAVLVDAPNDTVSALLDEAAAAGWEVVGLWLTHGHFDHIADHQVVTARYPMAKVAIHRLDEPKLDGTDAINRMFPLPFEIPPRKADMVLEDGQKLAVGSLEFEVILTPGHARGHVCFHCASEKVLAGGDLIIGGSIGRTDLPDSSYPALQQSIRRIMQLPPDTRLLPGHGEPTTLEHELQTNDYVREAIASPGSA
jgi:hydroxyacylglutathione hydrolase